jgi:hypothetical protein
MLPTRIPTPVTGWSIENPILSDRSKDMSLFFYTLFYALLDDEKDLDDVFGEFIVPVAAVR